MTRDIFLVHEDTHFVENFQEKLRKNGTRVTCIMAHGDFPQTSDLSESVVVIDAEKNWERALQTLENLKKQGTPFYAIVSEGPLLQKTMTQIDSTSEQLALNGTVVLHKRRKTDQEGEPSFSEIIEHRLAEFVKKIKASDGKNLYELLIQEVEKPLIRLALNETAGNQVQASELLGMHRNTLRKKMKELQIPSSKKTQMSTK